jgi:hypothetical protein
MYSLDCKFGNLWNLTAVGGHARVLLERDSAGLCLQGVRVQG